MTNNAHNANNALFPWQLAAWSDLQAMRERLPHAILLHGPEGIGKTVFSQWLAQSLLCEAPLAQGHACGICASCGWFVQYSHPDYRRVRPELLDEEAAAEGAAGEGTEAAAEEPKKSSKSAKPSKEIKIDQIRALADFLNISTHRRGRRIVLLHPAEALNAIAANSLLKTLEEPPPDTVFLLVSNNIDRLLPTILSRCRKFALPLPDTAVALTWLQQQGVADADVWLAQQGGAPLAAQAVADAGARESADILLAHLQKPGAEEALKTAEKLQKVPVSELVELLQRWLSDLFSCKLAGRIRYYPRYAAALEKLAARADHAALLDAMKAVNQRRMISDHPLAPKLFIEDMLLDYATIFS
ncbi:MAG: DNA polymerase III subunit delta' [Janthinobacterium lividum]